MPTSHTGRSCAADSGAGRVREKKTVKSARKRRFGRKVGRCGKRFERKRREEKTKRWEEKTSQERLQ
jgi:hypothetical protein